MQNLMQICCSIPGVCNLLVSLGHTGRIVVLGQMLNTLRHVITKTSHVLSKFNDFVLGHIHSHPEQHAAHRLQVRHPACSVNSECTSHTVHMLTQWHLPPLLISTVKLSLFMHVHSSQLYLAARLHRCHENHFHINNGWTFPG